ncbi:MAG: sugar ABC transporter ATP-binding protein [Lachnospiraceae bacterium]|nr:sugar ABC transporter ATP-binding protein [Lachnospiraceae bacterium]
MNPTVEIKNMSKRFGPTVALNDVSFEAFGGEVLGLIGENGSGKSTATSIYAGMQACDSGEMRFKGESWTPASMTDALLHGVGMIVQESGTVPGITVAENVFLGETKDFMNGPFVDRKRMISDAQKALDRIGAGHISASKVTAQLDFQDRKLTEIAKVMAKDPEVLIVDETTTALSQKGREIIYGIMEQMKKEGRTVIFISHDLDEIMDKCDRLTVLRDGKIIRTFTKNEFDPDAIRTSMIGREIEGSYYRNDFNDDAGTETVLKAEDLCLRDQLDHFSFELHAGEILGVGGLSHCGMHTLGKVLFGAEHAESGNFSVRGKTVRNEAEAMKAGIGYVAKDRDVESLCTEASIRDNIAVAGLDKFAVRNFLILPGKEKAYVDRQVESLSIKCRDADQYVSALSGGNKQKVAFGKWTGRQSDVLILDCPTRGVDIGVKQAMYRLMYQMRQEGKSILLISEEMTELIGMADRLLIMKDGRLEKELFRSPALSEADVIRYMI